MMMMMMMMIIIIIIIIIRGKYSTDSLQKTAILETYYGKYCSVKLEA